MLLVQLVVIDYTCPWALRGFNLLPKFKNWKVKPPILKRRINFFWHDRKFWNILLTYLLHGTESFLRS